MIKIKNKARQELPVEIIVKGKRVRKFLVRGQQVTSEIETNSINNLAKKRMIRVTRIMEETLVEQSEEDFEEEDFEEEDTDDFIEEEIDD